MGFGSIWHWVILLVVVVLVFGTKKLRNVGKDLGGAVHDFKEGLQQEGKEIMTTNKTAEAKIDPPPSADNKEAVAKDENKEA